MRKNTTEPAEPQAKPVEEPKAKKAKASGRNWRPIIFMGAIMILAAFVRVAFSYSVSAGSDFALSGGTDASNNLRFIESIVADHKIRFTDNWLNYPEGSLIVVPVLFDAIMAVFAFLFNAIMDDPIKASSFALALSGPLFGMLSCIPMYFVGKEMFSSKLAGYASAAFLALCPVFVQESVFSNGTGMSFAVFLFLFGVYFLLKALKGIQGDAVSAYKTSIIAGIFIAAAMGSWIDFRQVAIPFVIVMVAQTLIDRFKGRDPRPAATVYSMVLAIGFVVPCIGYTVVGYFDALVSGALIFIVLAIGFAMAYSWTYKKSWVLTLPICAGVCLLIMLVVAIAAPQLYGYIVSGNTYYDAAVLDMIGRQYLTLSQLTSYYGVVTYWFVFLVCLFMLYKVFKNSGSHVYIFTLVWLFTMTLTLGHDAMQAAFAAPVFALGFAALLKLVAEHIDFGAYFSGIKTGAGAKVKLKRAFSPTPLLAVLIAVFLVAGPNMMQVVDAGISSNDVDDYNDQISDVTGSNQFGTLNYYVKTDDTWTVRDALTAVEGGYGAVATWMSYSDDVKIYGNMKAFTDMYGNGTATASNILLANGVNGGSAAALLITAIMHEGADDAARSKLVSAGFSSSDVDVIFGVLDSVDYVPEGSSVSVKKAVLSDYDTYGAVDTGISDENVKYLYLTDFIATNYHSTDINTAYDSFGLRAPYIMVTGDMMPFFVGYASIFDQMAILNGYDVDTSYGTVSKFTTFGYYAYYYGIYDFTTAMYDTMLYRTYVGMTPTEAGYSNLYAYLTALSAADASVQMHPGYGLSNYEVAYWHVKYNPSNNATSDSDGWVEMDAKEAIALQKTDGGLINYLSGYPVILKYVSNNSGSVVTGSVKDTSSAGIENIRVVAVDSDGVVRATTHTSADGSYKIYVPDVDTTTLVFFAGAGTSSSGGTVVATVAANDSAGLDVTGVVTSVDVALYLDTSTSMSLLDASGNLLYDVKIANSEAGTSDSYTVGTNIASGTFTVGVGGQTVTVTDDDTEVASATFTVTAGTTSLTIPVKSHEYTVTVKDIYSEPLAAGIEVRLVGGATFAQTTDDQGTVVFSNVPEGSYDIEVEGYYVSSPTVSVSSTTTKTVTAYEAAVVAISGVPTGGIAVYAFGDAYSTSVISDSPTVDMLLPVSGVSATKYTVFCIYDGQILSALVEPSTGSATLTAGDLATVSGYLKNSDGENVSGTVYFVTSDGKKFKYSATADDGYKAHVPAGDVFVYATDSSDAYIGSANYAAGANTDKDISMSDADKVSSSSVYWSSVYYSYIMVDVTVDTVSLPIMTSSGAFSFYLPRGTGATVTITPTALFKEVTDTVESSHDADTTVSGSLTIETPITMTVNNDMGLDGATNLSIGGTKKTLDEWSTETFTLSYNSRSVVLGESDGGLYYSGTHRFNPETAAASIDLSDLINGTTAAEINYYMVTVSDYTSDYTVKVYYSEDNEDYVTVSSTEATRIASVADSTTDYRIEIVNSEKTKFFTETYPAGTVDTYTVAACVDAASVSGYVGTNVDTELYFVEGGNTTVADVTDGTYSVVLKKDVEYNVTIGDFVDGSSYTLDQNVTFTEATVKCNFRTDVSPYTVNVDVTSAITTVGQVSKVEFTVPAGSFPNTTEEQEKFSFTVGSGWQSYSFSVGTGEISGFVLSPGDTSEAVTFVGYYNPSLYVMGSADLLITVAGDTDTYKVRFTGYTGTDGLVLVNKASDTVGDYTYEYAYNIINTGSSDSTITVGYSGITVPEGWTLFYEYSNDIGTYVTEATASFVAIPGTTAFKLVLMPTADATEVPEGTVTFSSSTGIGTSTPDDVTVSEGKASSSAEAASAEVSVTDISASGRDVVNDKGSVPVIVWVMIAGMALLLILIFWMASKRGVFSRKK